MVSGSVLALCFFYYSNSIAQAIITNPVLYDDTYAHVPLQFGFPFYDRTFTNSWMHSNGVISFLDPAVPINDVTNPGAWAYCCQGIRLEADNLQHQPQFSFIIAPLWTDLIPIGSSSFRTQGTNNYQRYFWNDIAEYSNRNNLNSFSVEIRPSGFIGVEYTKINISNQTVSAGLVGDVLLGQMQSIYYGNGIVAGSLNNWNINQTHDQCVSDPLSSPTCPGYDDAMCISNPLYSESCSGYQQAYFTQQCAINALYDPNCPGYASSYLDYQCSLDPLYSSVCNGYNEAYYVQQCTINPLYDAGCNGYSYAYATNQLLTSTESDKAKTETNITVIEDLITKAASVPQPSITPASDVTAPVKLVTVPNITKELSANTSVNANTKLNAATNSTEKKDQPKTTRQQLAEKKLAAAKQKAIEAGKTAANDMSAAASIEDQIAVQNIIIQAMGFNPEFDAYSKVFIPDGQSYKPFTVYSDQKNYDNRGVGNRLFKETSKVYHDIIDLQHNLGK